MCPVKQGRITTVLFPKGPTYYSPLADEKRATERQQLILSLMENQGKISAEEKSRAMNEQLVYKSDEWMASKSIAPYFEDVVWAEASEILESQGIDISEGGWTIKTTLNQAHQQAAEKAVAQHMPETDLQVGLVSMDSENGFVTALVGGRDYSTNSFNNVTSANRQPGSTIKPFLYTAALENGYTPMTFKDVSQTTFTYDNGRKTYTPKNVNGQFATHEMSIAQALAISDNIYAVKTLEDIEAAILSDNFWEVKVVQDLAYTSTINPTYLVYLAAQVAGNDMSLLSNNITVKDLIEISGDVHHIFPKEYLKSNGYSKNLYNQDANYAYLDTQVNKSIGKKAPCEYLGEAIKQCETTVITCGSITDLEQLRVNLATNCIPFEACDMTYADYETFLEKRRVLMAKKIRDFYYSL